MTNIGIKSSQLSDIRAALLESSKNNTLEPKQTENFGNQIKDVKLTATQNHNARLSQFRVFEAVNQSLLGTSGRDEDRSFRAIKERAKKDAFTDIDRLRTQTAMRVGQISMQDSLNKLQVRHLQ